MKSCSQIFETEALGLPIIAELTNIGTDYLITIRGGCRHHIGSISTAYRMDGRIQLEKTLLPEHRDDVISDMAAIRLCETFGATVTVVCGVHYDAPGKDGIREIVNAAEHLIDKIMQL